MRSVIFPLFLFTCLLAVSTCKDKNNGSPSPNQDTADPADDKDKDKDKSNSAGKEDPAQAPPIMQLVAGSTYNCALLYSSGEIKCWGSGGYAQLGQEGQDNIGDEADEMGDKLKAVKLGAGHTAKAVSAGLVHTCAILENNAVKCWGVGRFGRLGQGNDFLIGDEAGELENMGTVDLGEDRTAKAIDVGTEHTCAILDNDTVKCWGRGTSGKLGNGAEATLGDQVNEMGENLRTIDFGDKRTAEAISVGADHTCAILSDNQVKCWGNGSNGKLGYGNEDNIGDEANEVRDSLVVDLGDDRTAKAIDAGSGHTCAILDNDTVKCWGSGNIGKLGYNDRINRGDEAGQMGERLPVVNLGGTKRKAKAISAGTNHTCAILDDNTAKCWGGGSYGQLGLGNTDRLGDNTGEMENLKPINLGTGRTVMTIATGENHVCALLDNNTVKCWGFNDKGQLGSGNTDNLGDAPDEIGDKLPVVDLGFN